MKATLLKNREQLIEELESINQQIKNAEELTGISENRLYQLEREDLSIPENSLKSALEHASEKKRVCDQLKKNIEIGDDAAKALREKSYGVSREIKKFDEAQLQARRQDFSEQASKIGEKINLHIFQLQKESEQLKELTGKRNQTYTGEIHYHEKWIHSGDINDFIERLDDCFLYWDQNNNLRFTGQYCSGFGNSEGRKNLAKVKQQIEEKFNEQQE